MRYARARDLAAFYGRPACELTVTELWIFGLVAGGLTVAPSRDRDINPDFDPT